MFYNYNYYYLIMQQIKSKQIKYTFTSIPFIVYFLYFALLNPHHIHYLEQSQLFIFSFDFIKEQFSLPGGLAIYLGSFFTQFFISSVAGALIYTLNALGIFLLSNYILRKHNLDNILIALVPVWLMAVLQSNELFRFSQATGFLILLSYFSLYISINKQKHRYVFFFAGWPVLYLLAGGFSLPAVLLCLLHELLLGKTKRRYLVSFLFLITGIVSPYVFSRNLYYIQPDKVYVYPVDTGLSPGFLHTYLLLLGWPAIMIVVAFISGKIRFVANRLSSWNLTNVIAGAVIFFLVAIVVYKRAYNRMADMMLGVDYYAQQSEWEKLLKLSQKYPGYNTLVIYYTNLALYQSGQLLDKMFCYPQFGSQGLRLKWQRNLNLFFGGEVFHLLSYNNESIHWAFEALVAKGLNPRSLKKLSLGCIVNGNNDIAEKYLSLLNSTLFYKKWARERIRNMSDPELVAKDPEISTSLNFLAKTNFFSEVDGMNLEDLLDNHPQNKMAYEYKLASLLLERNLDEFASAVHNIKEHGYEKLPLYVEEALIFYNFYENKNIIPEGYSIHPENITRFNEYARYYTMYRNDRRAAVRELGKKYGETYWYYLQFPENSK